MTDLRNYVAKRGGSRWGVFVSAGDFSNVLSWIPPGDHKAWHLVTAFYGDSDDAFETLAQVSDVIVPAKGSKFQNLKRLFQSQPGLFDCYDFIWVADDDLTFNRGSVERLFELAERFDFWVCQPAFNAEGRISHPVTQWASDGTIARIVNFVEMTCPVFRSDCLRKFLAVYDGSLTGWGIDWWFCHVLGSNSSYKFAVLDEVIVTNPRGSARRTPP